MVIETDMVDVIFRVDRDGEVFALMPGLAGTNDPATCTSYQHIGQHSSASLVYCRKTSKPATEEQATPLLMELQAIGYSVNVIKYATRTHFKQRVQQL